MSIFSRLFKGEDADKSATEEEDAAAPAGEHARKPSPEPGSSPIEGKGSMRPMAPSFQINPPVSERSGGPIAATPVVQVGAPASRPGGWQSSVKASVPRAQEAPPPYAQAPADAPAQRGKSAATVRMGTQALPASPANATGKALSGAQKVAPPPPPPIAAPGRPSPPASPAAAPSRAAPSRPKLNSTATNLDGLKGPPPRAPSASDDPGVDGLLTLELGTSLGAPAASNVAVKRSAITAQGLAPAAQAATVAARAANPEISTSIDGDGNLAHDLDEAFGAIVGASNGARSRPASSPPNGALAEVRELFASLAANHMRQVREFMIGVKWGEAPRDWIPICQPAVASLLRAAKEMELADLCETLGAYGEELGRAAETSGATIAQETRDSLMAVYTKLVTLMPEAFGLEGERGRRETIIVHALLQQVPDVRKVTIDKIYAAGLTNLDNLFLARPDEIAATTGIGENIASRIVEKFQRYRREIASLADATRASERRRLAELASELRGLHQEFERAASGWSDDDRAEKKKLRQARAEALLQVKVLLARLGEVDRLGRIERLPFERKIEHLEEFLREAREAPVP
jgi:hypothetical protein